MRWLDRTINCIITVVTCRVSEKLSWSARASQVDLHMDQDLGTSVYVVPMSIWTISLHSGGQTGCWLRRLARPSSHKVILEGVGRGYYESAENLPL